MIDHVLLAQALSDRLEDLEVVTTGSITLSASGSTYARSSGSFLTDGFMVGMETLDWNGTRAVVEVVGALTLTVNASLPTSSAAAGRSLVVGVPEHFAYENIHFDPASLAGAPWFEEEMVSGPGSQTTIGGSGSSRTVEHDPLLNLFVHVAENTGIEAVRKYADAVCALFSPNYAFTLSDGTAVRVRTDTAPYSGPLRRQRPGYVTVRVTIPLRTHLVTAA